MLGAVGSAHDRDHQDVGGLDGCQERGGSRVVAGVQHADLVELPRLGDDGAHVVSSEGRPAARRSDHGRERGLRLRVPIEGTGAGDGVHLLHELTDAERWVALGAVGEHAGSVGELGDHDEPAADGRERASEQQRDGGLPHATAGVRDQHRHGPRPGGLTDQGLCGESVAVQREGFPLCLVRADRQSELREHPADAGRSAGSRRGDSDALATEGASRDGDPLRLHDRPRPGRDGRGRRGRLRELHERGWARFLRSGARHLSRRSVLLRGLRG